MKVNDLKKYQKKSLYSYSYGTFPTFELLIRKAETVEMVLVHSTLKDEIKGKLDRICKNLGIEMIQNDRYIEWVRDKENCVVIGVFKKYYDKLEHYKNHVVLVNPSDSGNLGTIMRSCAGFGIQNVAVIEPAVDCFHPKVIRASMGAFFSLQIQRFECFDQYYEEYGKERECYPFMLNGNYQLGTFRHSDQLPYSLIFGNEASGLDASFLQVGKSVVIAHSDLIDSLNLALATGIGIYEFSKLN